MLGTSEKQSLVDQEYGACAPSADAERVKKPCNKAKLTMFFGGVLSLAVVIAAAALGTVLFLRAQGRSLQFHIGVTSSGLETSEVVATIPMRTEISSDPHSTAGDIGLHFAEEKVAVIGSGSWGSAIAKIIGRNVLALDGFNNEVLMWVRGDELATTVNTKHENPKYLPGIKLPVNVVAKTDLASVVEGATLLVFCLPHQFMDATLLNTVKDAARAGARGISLTKGIEFDASGPILMSDMIKEGMGGMDISVLMGANVALEVAKDEFSESTVASKSVANGEAWRKVLDYKTFRVGLTNDVAGAELSGALKNVVALGAGFCDGLGYGGNTKAAIIRIGLQEIRLFASMFFKGVKDQTFFESCGIADLITTCYGGRNRKCAEAFTRGEGTWEEIEAKLLDGQKLQGTGTAQTLYEVLVKNELTSKFPLFTRVYQIAFEGYDPKTLFEMGRSLSDPANGVQTQFEHEFSMAQPPIGLNELVSHPLNLDERGLEQEFYTYYNKEAGTKKVNSLHKFD